MTIYYNKYMGAGITGLLLVISSVMVFLVGLAAVGGGMIVYWVLKRRQQDSYDEWDDDEAE